MGANGMGDLFLEAMKAEGSGKPTAEPRGNLRSGKVIAISDSDVFLDLGSKSECVIPIGEFDEKPSMGDTIDVVLKDSLDGIVAASVLEAKKVKHTDSIKKAFDEGLAVSGVLTDPVMKDGNPKGYSVDLGYGIRAFLPMSHMELRKDEPFTTYKGQKQDLAVIEYRRGSVTVSRREFLQTTIKKLYQQFFETRQVGDQLHAKAERVEEDYMVLSADGIRVFMHISDFSWKFLSDLRAVVKVGDEMDVMVTKLDATKNSVKVGRKQLTPDPWMNLSDRFSAGQVVKGKVINFRKEGALVEVEDGVEGFLPVEEMSWTSRVRDPKQLLKLGDVVEVKISSIEADKRRMNVSLREIQENPWNNASENYPEGKKVEGVVTSIVDFGIFLRFDDGIEGLMRREDVDWLDASVDLKKKFKKGDRITVMVLSVDPEHEKIRLGFKQLSDNPYKAFSMNYPRGSAVTASVSAVLDNGVTVALENNLEGFIHISQLSKDKVEKASDVLKVGDEIKALVKSVDSNKHKIELSIRDFVNHEERSEVAKYMADDEDDSQKFTMGALLKDQFANIKLEKKDGKKKA